MTTMRSPVNDANGESEANGKLKVIIHKEKAKKNIWTDDIRSADIAVRQNGDVLSLLQLITPRSQTRISLESNVLLNLVLIEPLPRQQVIEKAQEINRLANRLKRCLRRADGLQETHSMKAQTEMAREGEDSDSSGTDYDLLIT